MAQSNPFRIEGIDRVLALFDQMPKRIQRELFNELRETTRDIENAAKREAPKDEGQIARSISNKQIGDLEFQVVAQTKHAGYMEFGTGSSAVIPAGLQSIASGIRGPGGGSGSPIDALEAWVKRKQISGRYSTRTRRRLGNAAAKKQEDRRVAYLIWQKIKRKGLKPRPYFYKQVPIAEKKLKQRVATIIQSII